MPEDPANVNTTSALPDDIREAVSVNNVKTIGETAALLSNLATANAIHLNNMANQSALQLQNAVTGRVVNHILDTKIDDAAAIQKIASGNDLGQQLAQLGSVIAQIQQTMKGAQTTPPPTSGG